MSANIANAILKLINSAAYAVLAYIGYKIAIIYTPLVGISGELNAICVFVVAASTYKVQPWKKKEEGILDIESLKVPL